MVLGAALAAEHCPAMKGFETRVAAADQVDDHRSRALPRNEGV